MNFMISSQPPIQNKCKQAQTEEHAFVYFGKFDSPTPFLDEQQQSSERESRLFDRLSVLENPGVRFTSSTLLLISSSWISLYNMEFHRA